MSEAERLRVGIIGAGEVSQVIHLPTLSLLSHLYEVKIIADISRKTVEHCATKFHIPESTTNPENVINHDAVDLVFVLSSDEYHAPLTIAALKAGKDVFLEKPVTLSLPSAQRIVDAERASGGKRIFVGYMRRYAPSFTAAFKREVSTMGRILYARVRDFSGPNAYFVNGSGTFQVKNTDFPSGSAEERSAKFEDLFREALPGQPGQGVTDEKRKYVRFLGSLGSHDISLMREVLGYPTSVGGVSVNDPFYTAIFQYNGLPQNNGHPFAVTYESGIDSVPVFDAHLAIYGEKKRVAINYDSPYVKGLPIRVTVDEMNEHGELVHREILSSYEAAYTAELTEMHNCFVTGKPIKTSLDGAINDLRLYNSMYAKHEYNKSFESSGWEQSEIE